MQRWFALDRIDAVNRRPAAMFSLPLVDRHDIARRDRYNRLCVSRMESSGVPKEIQVTRDVYDRLKDAFELEPRGTIKVKGKGEMETFLLKGAKP